MMSVCTAQLELSMRIQWLALSSVLGRLHNDTLSVGSSHCRRGSP